MEFLSWPSKINELYDIFYLSGVLSAAYFKCFSCLNFCNLASSVLYVFNCWCPTKITIPNNKPLNSKSLNVPF